MKIIALVFVFAACVNGETTRDSRQKRLLFYDEDGNLVKTSYPNPYTNNPYLQSLRLNAGHLPYYGSFINPFFNFIKDYGNIFALTVPVSNDVIQQIQKDPEYHNKFMITRTPDPVVEPNPLCEGKRTQIPSPKLCNNYLNCWDGWAVEQECPTGLLFSNQGYCDYSDNVNCESRKLREQPPTQPQCKKDFESFRSALDCNEFFVCVGRQPVKFKCPADLAYNQLLGVCDYPARVDCSSTAINIAAFPQSTSPAAPPTTAAPAFPAPSPPSNSIDTSSQAPSLPISPALPAAPSLPIAPSSPPASLLPIAPSSPPVLSLPIAPSFPISPIGASGIFSSPLFPTISASPATIKPGDTKTIFSENSVVNTQSWTSTNVAMSRQDAIRQLQQGNIPRLDA